MEVVYLQIADCYTILLDLLPYYMIFEYLWLSDQRTLQLPWAKGSSIMVSQ